MRIHRSVNMMGGSKYWNAYELYWSGYLPSLRTVYPKNSHLEQKNQNFLNLSVQWHRFKIPQTMSKYLKKS